MLNIMGLRKNSKSLYVNCGPLSDAKVPGYPNMVKTCSMIVSVIVDFNDMVTGYLDL